MDELKEAFKDILDLLNAKNPYDVVGLIRDICCEAIEYKDCTEDWQPIETAPKDGTAILVYPATWGSQSASIATWNDDRQSKKPRPFWSRQDSISITLSRDKPPTHWMPLPAPPETGETK